jgi:hypothetical protein
MGLAAAIVVITSDSVNGSDASDKALMFLLLVRYGVFAAGLIAGLAGLVQSYRSREAGDGGAIVGFLYFWAFVSFVIATAAAGVTVYKMSDSSGGYGGGPDASDKASAFIPYFIQGVFFAGVMVGVARWVSLLRTDQDEEKGRGFLYFLAFFVFCLGLALASLAITGSNGGESSFFALLYGQMYASVLVSWLDLALCTTEKAAMFLTIFVPTGLLCGCVLAGLAAITPKRWQGNLGMKCAHCGKEISSDWKACPYCGEAVKPIASPVASVALPSVTP